ncbi:bcl2-associated agonist of cell death [Salmo salar]|uniref:Bcl2 antagonist of cell death n=1 Tax=Salmo salar TaxID=8030 RepID=B5X1T1_SALSA|nr:bcl2-associated agonist of cell death [Salmo salar]ACI33262.1 Bcl2 antagonist of cell death [Salmo salar]ACI67362.1 Bcl2 antagonist of cell death [Salmo salar]ACN12510.1 Bcl2 antagonist of cell death [Salmo salar]|eukprot:XP_014051932.1 PREDICTED: bcl2-associated agonist of cell death-like [Salmo salar]
MDHTHDCVDDNPETMNEHDESDHSGTTHYPEFQRHYVSTRTGIRPRPGGRVRLYSESQVCSQVGRRDNTEFQDVMTPTEEGGGDGAPFRSRSQSAPPTLWAAKKYGRQLRRMSDEFDTWLDKGEPKRGISPGGVKQEVSRGWFSFLWSPKKAEGRE